MNVLNKLTIKSLSLNKKRTIVTIIGITLSVALICAISTFIASFQHSLVNMTKKTDGNYHILLQNVSAEEQPYILQNAKVEQCFLSQDIGYAKLEGSKNQTKPYLFMTSMSDKALQQMGIKLTEGRFPTNGNEVVVPDHILRNGGVTLNVGDTLTLDIGKRWSEGEEASQDVANYEYDRTAQKEVIKEEEIVPEFTKQYTIVGIIERPKFESYDAPGYTVITRLEDNNVQGDCNIAVLLKNPKDAYTFPKTLSDATKVNFEEKASYNDELLQFQGVMKNNSTMGTILVLAIIVIGIIVFTSIFVIKNSFSISITERLRQYGMLSSIGATSKQIKKNVLFEGFILGVIAIPLGIFVGIVAIAIVIAIVNVILGDMITGFSLGLVISLPAILVSIVISAVTIWISSLIPAVKASRISPLTAIRENNDIKMKSKKLKSPKWFKKIFGIEGEIASKNLKRSRKKYRTTIFSIFLSIVMFISISTFIEYGFKTMNLFYQKSDYNLSVYYYGLGWDGREKAADLNSKITKLDGISSYSINKMAYTYAENGLYQSDATKEYLQKLEGRSSDLTLRIYAVNEEEYQRYVQKIGGNMEDLKDKAILIDHAMLYGGNESEGEAKNKRTEINVTNLEEGSNIHLKTVLDEDRNNVKELDIKVGKRTKELPMGVNYEMGFSNDCTIIIPENVMNQLYYEYSGIYINASNPDALEQEILKIGGIDKSRVSNTNTIMKENNAMVLVLSIFLYGFIAVISVIGITNIFNTITTNMALRNKEFAVLKSIGMTDKEFRKMINYESILYGLKSLLFGIPVGVGLSYLIYRAMTDVVDYGYIWPIGAIIISVIFVFAIVFITMQYSVAKSKKQNIIDTIRNENI